jgi:hypothetical protein
MTQSISTLAMEIPLYVSQRISLYFERKEVHFYFQVCGKHKLLHKQFIFEQKWNASFQESITSHTITLLSIFSILPN